MENETIKNNQENSICNEHILYKTKSSSAINPYLKYKNNQNYINSNSSINNSNNYSYSNRNSNKFLNGQKELRTNEENINKHNFIKETNKEMANSRNNKYLYKNEDKIPKQKSFMEDFMMPNDINKEYAINLNLNKDSKEYSQINFGTASNNDSKYINNNKQRCNSKIKKEKKRYISKYEISEKTEENKNYNSGNQRIYLKEYMNKNENNNNYNEINENFMGDQNNSKFIMYYKEIYGENKK